jgi:hypothetical protein
MSRFSRRDVLKSGITVPAAAAMGVSEAAAQTQSRPATASTPAMQFYNAKSPLLPGGHLGPVRIIREEAR